MKILSLQEVNKMKIEFDRGSAKVPEFLIKEYIEGEKEERDEDITKEEIEKNQDEYEGFCEWLEFAGIPNLMEKYSREIVDKELALFLVRERTGTISPLGGYSIENWMEFDVGKYRYHICAYGWTFECQDSKGRLDMIGYKEVI